MIDAQAIEGSGKSIEHDSGGSKSWESLKVAGLHRSMSVTDLVNHIGNRISEQVTSGSLPSAKASECHEMLENISQLLLSDSTHCLAGLDERSLMKKVDSLYSLLQDPAISSSALVDGENRSQVADPAKNVYFDLANDTVHSTHEKNEQAMEVDSVDGAWPAPGLPRKDSLSDLLLHLPRIASLPRFSNLLHGIAEGEEYQSP